MAAAELPIELWHRICSYCSKPAVRSLRLTCSGISAIADEWFMHDITMLFVREDFDMIEAIVENGRIASNVRTLHFQADMLPSTPNYKQWDILRRSLIEMDTRSEAGIVGADEVTELCSTTRGRRLLARERKRRVAEATRKHSKAALKIAYQHYLTLLDDQLLLLKEKRAQRCLGKVFASCTRLENAFVVLRDDSSPEARSWRASKQLLKTMVEPYGDTMTFQIGVRPVNETLLAAYEASRPLRELEMSPVSYQFFDQPESIMSKLYAVMRGVERLRISVNDRFNTDREDHSRIAHDDGQTITNQLFDPESTAEATRRVLTSFRDGRLLRFMENASSLRQLSIVPPGEVQWWPGQLRLKDIIGTVTWPCLQTLGLCNFNCDAEELTDLLLRHSQTLEDLGLGHVEFLNGGWKGCFETFAGKLPNLRVADLHGTFRDSVTVDGPLRLSCYCGEDTIYGPHVLCAFTKEVNKYVIDGGAFPEIPEIPLSDTVTDSENGGDTDDEVGNEDEDLNAAIAGA